jgi:hypothetical protein
LINLHVSQCSFRWKRIAKETILSLARFLKEKLKNWLLLFVILSNLLGYCSVSTKTRILWRTFPNNILLTFWLSFYFTFQLKLLCYQSVQFLKTFFEIFKKPNPSQFDTNLDFEASFVNGIAFLNFFLFLKGHNQSIRVLFNQI